MPVAQKQPAMVPFLELADGRTVLAGDCADEIHPAPGNQQLRVLWRRMVALGTEAKGGLVDPAATLTDAGLTSEVTWKLDGDTLVRAETITATRPTALKRLSVIFPSTGGQNATRLEDGRRIDRFTGPEGTLEVTIGESSVPLETTIEATGDSLLGKGARIGIPLVLRAQSGPVSLKAGETLRWTMRVRALGQ
jgi:hypothetical protein